MLSLLSNFGSILSKHINLSQNSKREEIIGLMLLTLLTDGLILLYISLQQKKKKVGTKPTHGQWLNRLIEFFPEAEVMWQAIKFEALINLGLTEERAFEVLINGY